ncbi:microtubule-associated tyrosine carboxypeptidase 1 isoform X2 [Alosa pseudoharengus]|uniref:microtubule-associated tyrosine carboxypeptidase 1 isoform X2 n=1 Tax=Alosa pseudoharengus TaxID=34774 RepID=UPI003F89980C
MVLDLGDNCMEQTEGMGAVRNSTDGIGPEAQPDRAKPVRTRARTSSIGQRDRLSHNGLQPKACSGAGISTDTDHKAAAGETVVRRGTGEVAQATGRRASGRRPLSLEVTPQRLRTSQTTERKILQPPWRSGAPSPPMRSLTSPSLGPEGGWMRRSESTCTMNASVTPRPSKGRIRSATSLPHIAKLGSLKPMPPAPSPRVPCLLVALRPINLEQERQTFFESDYQYEPQFEYVSPEPVSVLEKYKEGSGLFLSQVVVCLSDELLSQAVMMVERCRPTLTINLQGARQHWLEGMLRHEIGTHYLRGVNNNLQPWSSAAGRKKFGLKPANPTEEGLASLHSVLLRKQPYLWRAALLYYTVHHAANMSFSQLFSHIARFVQDPAVRWEYCIRAKRGQTDTSKPGCFSKDQVYLDGILRILRHRRNIDFKMLTSLGKVSYEDVERLRHMAVLHRTRIPHFMQDEVRYLQHLDYIVEVNELDDAELQNLVP